MIKCRQNKFLWNVAVLMTMALLFGSACAQDTVTGTELGQGIVTRVDVAMYADITLDVKDLRSLLAAGDIEGVLLLYTNGKNAALSTTQKFSIRQMSYGLQTLKAEVRTPPYNYHLFGLAGRDITPSNLEENALYADYYVKSFMKSKSEVAADAIVALHCWMYAAHLLYHGVRTCDQLTKADNPEIFHLAGGGMDEFIALWIGRDQTAAANDGHSLYSLTQRAGELFDTARPGTPEAPTNSNIKLLYQEGAVALSFANACSRTDSGDTVPALWSVTQRIMSQMFVPLIQLLIDALMRQDTDSIRLYAVALVPQISQCRPSIYKRLKEALLDGTTSLSSVDSVIADLQAVYDCLGVTCQDVGAYQVDKVPQCGEIPVNFPLAEYVPSTHVHDHSKIDLDVLQLGILTSLSSYPYAQLLYMYGRNSPYYRASEDDPYRVRSLMEMATSNARKLADPFYTYFVKYHNNQNYADKAIQDTLGGKGKWGNGSPEQIKQLVVTTSAYHILYLNALAEIEDAVGACKKGDMLTGDGGAHQWDEVAAFLIGSLEGGGEGGSGDLEDGQLLWNLANKRAFQFQTEAKNGYSLINVDLEDLLFAGRAEANSFDCGNLERSMDRIQHLILLPVIQSTIRYAIINQGLSSNSTNGDLAEGETMAMAVLPIIAQYDENAASTIRQNMEVQPGQPLVRDGPQAVANAFYQALDEFGYSCALVGATPQADACALQGGFSNVKPSLSGSTVNPTRGTLILTVLVAGLVALMY